SAFWGCDEGAGVGGVSTTAGLGCSTSAGRVVIATGAVEGEAAGDGPIASEFAAEFWPSPGIVRWPAARKNATSAQPATTAAFPIAYHMLANSPVSTAPETCAP